MKAYRCAFNVALILCDCCLVLFAGRTWLQQREQSVSQPLGQNTIATTGLVDGSGPVQAFSDNRLPVTQDSEETNADIDESSEWSTTWEVRLGDYTIRTTPVLTNDFEQSRLEVWQGQTLVYETDSDHFELASEYDEDKTNAFLDVGANITGNGIPNLVVAEYTGGAHCCFIYHIFELGEQFRLVDTIEGLHSEVEFVDLDGDGIPEIKMTDWSYAYEFGCFATSPAPDMILRYAGGHYAIAPDLMQTPTPTDAELQSMAAEIKNSYPSQSEDSEFFGSPSEWPAGSGLWQQMLDLIYGGHEDEAHRLFDMAWPEEAADKESTLSNFVDTVSGSLYWQAVYGGEENQEEPAVDNPTPESQPLTQAEADH